MGLYCGMNHKPRYVSYVSTIWYTKFLGGYYSSEIQNNLSLTTYCLCFPDQSQI